MTRKQTERNSNNNKAFTGKVAVWRGMGSRVCLRARVLRAFIIQMSMRWTGGLPNRRPGEDDDRAEDLGGGGSPAQPRPRRGILCKSCRKGRPSSSRSETQSEEKSQDSVLQFSRDRKKLG